jgi:tryptophan synthase beta chain
MVRRFQEVIGIEARQQMLDLAGSLPDKVYACVGGGSNAIGIFSGFLENDIPLPSLGGARGGLVSLIGVEAAGHGLETGEHAAPLTAGSPGVLHGAYSYLMQDDDGQILPTHSVSAGLDYPGVGPEHSFLKDSGRVSYTAVTDKEAMDALVWLSRLEGIIPAFESAHAFAALRSSASAGEVALVNLSGRGDKDMESASRILEL